jgi:hypothetical protein
VIVAFVQPHCLQAFCIWSRLSLLGLRSDHRENSSGPFTYTCGCSDTSQRQRGNSACSPAHGFGHLWRCKSCSLCLSPLRSQHAYEGIKCDLAPHLRGRSDLGSSERYTAIIDDPRTDRIHRFLTQSLLAAASRSFPFPSPRGSEDDLVMLVPHD